MSIFFLGLVVFEFKIFEPYSLPEFYIYLVKILVIFRVVVATIVLFFSNINYLFELENSREGLEKKYRKTIETTLEVIEQLNDREKKLNAIFEYSNTGIVLMNSEEDIIFVNPTFSAMLGYRPEYLHEKKIEDLTHPEDRNQDREFMRQLANGEIHNFIAEKRFVKKDRNSLWARVSLSGVYNHSEIEFFILIAENIDSIKEAESALLESEKKFRLLAEKIEHVLWIGTQNNILYVNPAYVTMFEGKPEDLYRDRRDFLHKILDEDKERVLQSFKKIYTEEMDFDEEYRIRKSDGSIRWIWSRTFVFRASETSELMSVGIAQDITERKNTEQKLREALDKERELNRLKSDFVSMVSHQFRTPLTSIKSSIQILEMYLEDFEKKTTEKFQNHYLRIQSEIDRLNYLLDDILTFGRLNSLKFSIKRSSVDMVQLCRSILGQRFDVMYKDRKIVFSFNGFPYKVYVDEGLMIHIISNLLANAYKYSSGSPVLFLDFRKNDFMIVIKDNGIGIPKDEQKNLFQSFFRASNSSNIQGTGLGLVVVKEFVELHNGKIEVVSELNRGTEFKITIPIMNQ